MQRVVKRAVFTSAAVAVSVAICLFAYFATEPRVPGTPPWYSIVPPLLAVTLALVTNRIFLSLGAAVFTGGLLSLCVTESAAGRFEQLVQGSGALFVCRSLADIGNLLILLFVVLVMAMISVMLASGGLQGVAHWLMKYARSVRSTKLVTMAAGLIIFIDDYANTMIVGATLRPLTDRQRISREKLAFLVDATAAPVAGIAVISTWIGVEVGLLSQIASDLGVAKDGYAIFFDALGFRFYCIVMIAFVFFNAFTGEDFGPMAKAEQRAGKQGKLLADGAKPMTSNSLAAAEPHPQANIHAAVAVVPMMVLLLVFIGKLWFDAGGWARPASALLSFSVWREALGTVNSIPLLAFASGCGLVAAMALAGIVAKIPLAAMARAVLVGIRGSQLPATVLVLAWSLKGTCNVLHTGDFLANALGGSMPPFVVHALQSLLGESLSGLLLSVPLPFLFPAMVFVVAAMTSFATGTSWGTMAILIPTAVPVAFKLDGEVYGLVTIISVAAVLDGAIFGDHCSPISDTTIMSSAASSCDHIAHVRTQMPYSLTVAGLALVAGYLPAAMGVSKWWGILGGAALAGLLFLALWVLRRWKETKSPQ